MTKKRRQWSHEEKQRIVREAFERPGADKKAIAKREGVALSLIYRWEKELSADYEEYVDKLEGLEKLIKERYDEIDKHIAKHKQAIVELEKEKADFGARLMEMLSKMERNQSQ